MEVLQTSLLFPQAADFTLYNVTRTVVTVLSTLVYLTYRLVVALGSCSYVFVTVFYQTLGRVASRLRNVSDQVARVTYRGWKNCSDLYLLLDRERRQLVHALRRQNQAFISLLNSFEMQIVRTARRVEVSVRGTLRTLSLKIGVVTNGLRMLVEKTRTGVATREEKLMLVGTVGLGLFITVLLIIAVSQLVASSNQKLVNKIGNQSAVEAATSQGLKQRKASKLNPTRTSKLAMKAQLQGDAKVGMLNRSHLITEMDTTTNRAFQREEDAPEFSAVGAKPGAPKDFHHLRSLFTKENRSSGPGRSQGVKGMQGRLSKFKSLSQLRKRARKSSKHKTVQTVSTADRMPPSKTGSRSEAKTSVLVDAIGNGEADEDVRTLNTLETWDEQDSHQGSVTKWQEPTVSSVFRKRDVQLASRSFDKTEFKNRLETIFSGSSLGSKPSGSFSVASSRRNPTPKKFKFQISQSDDVNGSDQFSVNTQSLTFDPADPLLKYKKMLKVGIPLKAVLIDMQKNGIEDASADMLDLTYEKRALYIQSPTRARSTKSLDSMDKYERMQHFGVPKEAIEAERKKDGLGMKVPLLAARQKIRTDDTDKLSVSDESASQLEVAQANDTRETVEKTPEGVLPWLLSLALALYTRFLGMLGQNAPTNRTRARRRDQRNRSVTQQKAPQNSVKRDSPSVSNVGRLRHSKKSPRQANRRLKAASMKSQMSLKSAGSADALMFELRHRLTERSRSRNSTLFSEVSELDGGDSHL